MDNALNFEDISLFREKISDFTPEILTVSMKRYQKCELQIILLTIRNEESYM